MTIEDYCTGRLCALQEFIGQYGGSRNRVIRRMNALDGCKRRRQLMRRYLVDKNRYELRSKLQRHADFRLHELTRHRKIGQERNDPPVFCRLHRPQARIIIAMSASTPVARAKLNMLLLL